MSPATYGGVFAKLYQKDTIELFEMQPVRDAIGDKEADEVGFPFWKKEGSFGTDDLAEYDPAYESILSYVGLDEDGKDPQDVWKDLDPIQKAVLLLQNGYDDDYGTGGGYARDILPTDEILGMNDQDVRTDFLEADDSFDREILGKVHLYLCYIGMPGYLPNGDPFLVTGSSEAADWTAETVLQDVETEEEERQAREDWSSDPFRVPLPPGGNCYAFVEPYLTVEHDKDWVASEVASVIAESYNEPSLWTEVSEEAAQLIIEMAETNSDLRDLAEKYQEAEEEEDEE